MSAIEEMRWNQLSADSSFLNLLLTLRQTTTYGWWGMCPVSWPGCWR
ncbi:hypothetical protein [Streptomyces xanthophaeus]